MRWPIHQASASGFLAPYLSHRRSRPAADVQHISLSGRDGLSSRAGRNDGRGPALAPRNKGNLSNFCICLCLKVLCRFKFRKHAAPDAALFTAGADAARLPCGAVRGTLRGDVCLLNAGHVACYIAQHLFPGRRLQLRQQRRQLGIHFMQFSHVSPSRILPARPVPAPSVSGWAYMRTAKPSSRRLRSLSITRT